MKSQKISIFEVLNRKSRLFIPSKYCLVGGGKSGQLAGPCRWFASSRTSSGFKSQYKYKESSSIDLYNKTIKSTHRCRISHLHEYN